MRLVLMGPPGAGKGTQAAFIAGWVLTGLPAALLIFSGITKFIDNEGLREGFSHLGVPYDLARTIGTLELVSVALLLLPRTAVIGAILITGYMGGAILTHLRIHEPVIVQSILPVVIWLGLYLREPRLRALAPWRTSASRCP